LRAPAPRVTTGEMALHTCMLCEAVCGIRVDTDGERVTSIRGDADDPFSRGHLCPKAAALGDVSSDPDRVRQPLRRVGDRFVPIGWDEALDEQLVDALSGNASFSGVAVTVSAESPSS